MQVNSKCEFSSLSSSVFPTLCRDGASGWRPFASSLRRTFTSIDLFFRLKRNGIFVGEMDQEMIGINYEAGSFPLAWEQAKKRDQGPDKIRQSAFSSVVVAVLCRPGGAGATPGCFSGFRKESRLSCDCSAPTLVPQRAGVRLRTRQSANGFIASGCFVWFKYLATYMLF